MADFDLASCLGRLRERNPGRSEADIQADVRDLLLYGGFDLGEQEVRLEAAAEGGGRIDVALGAVVIECKRDLRPKRVRQDAEDQLAGYLRGRETANRQTYAGVLTDGAEWHYYLMVGDDLGEVDKIELRDPFDPAQFRRWLGAILATESKLPPTAASIEERLGSASPAYRGALVELAGLWRLGAQQHAVRLKRELWGKLLRTAFGTQFQDDEELFFEHTYLVLVAVLVGQAVMGFELSGAGFSPAAGISGERFAAAGLEGVGEAGFFDWVLDVAGGVSLVVDLARRVGCFAWQYADHDVLKALYQSVVSPETRHRLGEYYTPDWLAERIVAEVVDDPLHQRVLDPACGSGTFLFHAVRHYLAHAEGAGTPASQALQEVTAHVFGLDLHPVAVSLAQVTYLLAMGADRLRERTGSLSVPVYIGDSMRWEQPEKAMFTSLGEVVVGTGAGGTLFGDDLRFPASIVADASRFDRLVDELATRASDRPPGSPCPPIRGVLARLAVADEDRPLLEGTYKLLCRLRDDERDHIWGFYVRNQVRPAFFAAGANQVDVLVGNPPWLAYRYMPAEMQERFRQRSKTRQLWAGGKVATHQDLSAFFVARSVELFLRVGGRFGFVMPRAVLSRQQYEGFRRGDFGSSADHHCEVAFDTPWDLGEVDPEPFPVPSSVVTGRRVLEDKHRRLSDERLRFIGHAPRHGGWGAASATLRVEEGSADKPFSTGDTPLSPYAERFRQGATLVPRMLVCVVEAPVGPLGVPQGWRSVRSRRSSLDKSPWRDLPDQVGRIEDIFVRPTYLGEHVLPFRLLPPAEAVVPHDGTRLLSGADERIDRYPGLANWWRQAEVVWEEHKGAQSKLSLLERIDYHGELSAQLPAPSLRVVYVASGNTMAAAVVPDARSVIEHALYWGTAESLFEAR